MAEIKPTSTQWTDDGASLSPLTPRDIDLAAGQEYKIDGVALSFPEGTAVLSTGETVANKYLRTDGDGTSSWQETSPGDPRVDKMAYTSARTIFIDDYDMVVMTAQNQPITFHEPTGSPVNGQSLIIRLKDDGTQQAITWNAIFVAGLVAIPQTTTVGEETYIEFRYNSDYSQWDCVEGRTEGTVVSSTGVTGTDSYLRADGDGTSSWQTVDTGAGGLKADGSVPLTADWNAGAFDITAVEFNGALVGQADTVGTITGLAPDTATTAAAQPNITSVGELIGTELAAGTTTVAPMQFTVGTDLTSPSIGALEFDGTGLFITI